MGGELLRLLVASDAAGTAAVYELTNAPEPTLRVRVQRRIAPDEMVDEITVRGYARERVDLALELRVDADFRSIYEVRGVLAPIARTVRRSAQGDTLRLAATGLDGVERATTVRCAGASASDDGALRIPLVLEPGEERMLAVRYALSEPAATRVGGGGFALPGTEAAAWLGARPRVEVDDDLIVRVLERSLLDLRLLGSTLDGERYFAAGVPWYATLFGRDSIITALEVLAFDPGVGEQTLRLLAGRLGERVDDEHDEEPGKVIHELRGGELAAVDATPLTRYYGTVDATPLFLCLLTEHADWTGSLSLFRELRQPVEAALRWIDDHGDLDGDGLLEYRCRSSAGLVNQGWKDSWDGVVDEDGEPLEAPIALVEAQGYALRAKRRLARLFELDGDPERAERLREEAARLAIALDRFWVGGHAGYAMGLDASKRPSRALASNQGHLLWAVAVPDARAGAIRDALMTDAMYSGWGVRTLAAGERAFNPIGYHTGSVWPHDNALFALGLRNYGFDEAFLRVFADLLDAAGSFDDYRLPELFAGFPRLPYEPPVPYPVACTPQAWAAGALPAMLISGLGLIPDGLRRTLRIRRPSLPRQVNQLELKGLEVAGGRVDLRFERTPGRGDSVALTDVHIDGDVEVVLEIPPDGQVVHPAAAQQVHGAGGILHRA